MARYFPALDMAGKEILDLGSGYGGKAAFYLQQKPRSVVGIEPCISAVTRSREAVVKFCNGQVPQFIAGRGEELPVKDQCFDLIFSYHVFEHVQDLPAVLNECYRVLKPGGRLCAVFPPYYGPQAHHLDFITTLPGIHYWFSADTLIDAANDLLKEKPELRDPLPHNDGRLPALNGATVRSFRQLVSATPFIVRECAALPLGCGVSSGEGGAARLVTRSVARIGLKGPFQDPFTSAIRCELEKPAT